MGFGKKSVPTNRLSMAAKGTSSDGWGKPGELSTRVAAQQDNNGGAIALYASGGIIAFALTAGVLFYEDIPVHTYGATKIFVTQMGGTNYRKYKKTFSVVMPTEESVIDDVQYKLANACLKEPLRSKKQLGNIHPMRIHWEVKKAENYLTCAMQTNVERFCEPSERQLLIKQIETFAQMREGAFGIEGMFDKLQNGSAGGRANMMMFKIMHEEHKDDPTHYKVGTRLPRKPGAEFSRQISALSEQGYLTRWDFHWTGLSMPELVAPHLRPPTSEPACRKET